MRWKSLLGLLLGMGLGLGAAAGTPTAISVRVGLQIPQLATATYIGSPLTIPDAIPNGVDIPLTLATLNGAIRDVDLRIGGSNCAVNDRSSGITHSWVGDLRVQLTAPEGQTALLIDRPGAGSRGSSGDDFCQTWLDDDGGGAAIDALVAVDPPPLGPPHTGTFVPQEPLALFDGQPSQGTWHVWVSDLAPLDVGTVSDITLVVEALAFTPTASLSVDESVGTLKIAVALDNPSAEIITIPYVVSGTADSMDHNFTSGSVSFTSGQTLALIEGQIIDNAPEPEANETLIIALQPAMGVTLTDPSSITIQLLDGVTNTAPTFTLTGTIGVDQGLMSAPRPIGSLSDAQSTADSLEVSWPTLPQGLNVQLENRNGSLVAAASATCDVASGTYPFPVTITDTGGLTATQEVLLRVFVPSEPCGPNGLDVQITPSEAAGAPGSEITYTLTLTNVSAYSSTFSVVVTNTLWTVNDTQFAIDLAQGATAHHLIDLTIPLTASIPSFNQTMVTTTALVEPRLRRAVMVTTKAWIERGRVLIPIIRR